MPTTTVYINDPYVSKDRWTASCSIPGYPLWDYTSSKQTKTVINRDKSSRPRPNDLIAAMTPQGTASTAILVPGRFTKPIPPGTTMCNGLLVPLYGYDQLASDTIGSMVTPTVYWQNKVRQKFAKQTVNLASSCAEYRETGSSFVSMAKGVAQAYRDMRKLRFGKWLKPKKWADIYLAYKFGVKPLVEDVVTSAIRLNAYVGFPPRGVIRASDSEEAVSLAMSPYGGSRQVTTQVTARAVIYYTNRPGRQFLHAGTPLEWAWELIPFSFIVDWGIQVGDWLVELDALRGVNIVGGCVGYTTHASSFSDYVPASGYRCTRPLTWKYKAHRRELVSSVPLPKLRYQPSVTLERVKTALALMQNIRR